MAVHESAAASRVVGLPALREVVGRQQHISIGARAIPGTLDRLHALLVPHPSAVRVFLSDRRGRLRKVADRGEQNGSGEKHSGRRRAVFLTAVPARLSVRRPAGQALAILPLVAGAETLGLVEIQTTKAALEELWEALLVATSELALLIREDRDLADFKADLDAASASSLARELMRAGTPRAAVVAVLDFYFDWFKVPTAAWLSDGPGLDPALVDLRGLPEEQEEMVRSHLATIPRWESLTPEDRDAVVATFADLAGVREASVLHAGPAVFLAGGPWRSLRRSLDVLACLLEDAFDHFRTVIWAERRNDDLDLGIAVTAHEIRGPLVGIKAAIDRCAVRSDEPSTAELLRRSSQELDFLSDLADGLLRWAAGVPSLRVRRTDLVILAQQAVESCRLEMGFDHAVTVSSDGPAMVRGDSRHLRSAIVNLVRNALTHTPQGTKVRIDVIRSGDVVRLAVRDRGPGVSPDERETIFDPFVRGESGRTTAGNGLGLFITRKIAEAHGGKTWVESTRSGATFVFELPADTRT